ncbi:hypothetical protein L7F22_039403 [Adiantum nelumboides]|nr:hypothetical protein [Adiantum nelumboides]
MGMTWRDEPVNDEQAFTAMREAVKMGSVHWSTAEFYGPKEDPNAGIRLLKRYFEHFPEDAKKVSIYVKGCFDFKTFTTDGSDEGVRKSFNNVKSILGNTKSVDYFGPGRRDKKTPIEETMKTFKALIEEGEIKGVFLSEVGEETIRKAHAVQPLSAVEVEYSMFTQDILENGVGKATKDLNISILAYSPLGRGFLAGAVKSLNDIPKGDRRLAFDRFQGDNLDKNVKLAQNITSFAQKIGATPAQVALAWMFFNSDKTGKIIPIPGATKAERVHENSSLISLTNEQVQELNKLVPISHVSGGRANKAAEALLWG